MWLLVWKNLGAKRVQRAVVSKDRSVPTSGAFNSKKPLLKSNQRLSNLEENISASAPTELVVADQIPVATQTYQKVLTTT